MEADRRSKRKPLSDCTNTVATRRKKPQSLLPSKNSNLRTLIKPPKPSNRASTTIDDTVNVPAISSQKTHTSTGSNDSPNSVDVPSIRHSPERQEPPTPASDTGGRDCERSEPSVDQSQRHDDTTRKDKGKTGAYVPTIPTSAYVASEPPQIASSSSSRQRHDATLRKDKGKMVVDIPPIIPFFPYMANKPLRISSPSSSPQRSSHYDTQAVQSQNVHAQMTNDKEKTTVDASLISKHLEISTSGTSGSLSETLAAKSQTLHEEARKDKGKTVLDIPTIEESEPSTPQASFESPAASGTRDKPVTVYSQRTRQRRKHAFGKMNKPSSYSEQRTRKTRLAVDDDQSSKKGSLTDPLPLHKKKRSHGKHSDPIHVMPQEEVAKLRAYYADLDAFELPEEVASESDLD